MSSPSMVIALCGSIRSPWGGGAAASGVVPSMAGAMAAITPSRMYRWQRWGSRSGPTRAVTLVMALTVGASTRTFSPSASGASGSSKSRIISSSPWS